MKCSLLYFSESAHLVADDSWHNAGVSFFSSSPSPANLLSVSMVVLFK